MQDSNNDTSAPGTYGESDPGGGPYDEATGLREWYYADASIRFGQWLTERRKMLGMSQQEISDRLTAAGIKFHDSSVARIEKGKRRVTVDEAEVISRILGVDIGYMTALERPDDLQEWLEEQDRNRLRRKPGTMQTPVVPKQPETVVTRHPGSDLPVWRDAEDQETASERQSNATKA